MALPKRTMSIKVKFIGVLIIALLLSSIVFTAWNTANHAIQVEREMAQQAQALADEMNAIWRFISVNQDTINYTSDGEYEFKSLHCSIAGKAVGAFFTESTDYTIRYVNFDPRNSDDEPDAFEAQALTVFAEDAGATDYHQISEYNGDRVFRYLVPMYIDENCLECHGEPAGEIDVTGYPKEGWDIGSLGGAISIVIPLDVYEQNSMESIIGDAAFFVFLVLLVSLVAYFALVRLVINPLKNLQSAFGQMHTGNMKINTIERADSSREMQQLVKEFYDMSGELNEIYKTLENKVQLRTDELAKANEALLLQQEQLEHVNEHLLEHNQNMTDYLAMISHELKTPLVSIIAFIDLLQKTSDGDNSEDAIIWQRIKNNSTILLEMINNILVVTRIRLGKLDLELEVIDLVDLAAAVIISIEPLAQEKELTIVSEVAADIPLIKADGEKIAAILMNLLGNSIKFTPRKGTVSLTIDYQAADEAIRIRVEDTGIGIEEDALERIFERFTQGDSKTSRDYGGSGLGLALVREYTIMHGGSISIQSEVGEGTVFIVLIPAK